MAFCGQYPRKGLHILRRECAWHTSIWSLSSTTQHAQNVKIWSYCTFCVVTAWKRLLERLLLWGRKNKENTSNENGLILVYVLVCLCLSGVCCVQVGVTVPIEEDLCHHYCQHKFLTQPVCACCWFASSLTSQTLLLNSTDCFQYWHGCCILKPTGAVERKRSSLRI